MGFFGAALGLSGTVGSLWALRKWRETRWSTCNSQNRLDGQVVVLTGATSGLGRVLAEFLANRGAIVILACRNTSAAHQVVAEIKRTCPGAKLDVVELDLSCLESVRKCASQILDQYDTINILINNAGISIPSELGEKTKDGFEINFGVNHLGHFLFTNLLLDRIKASAPSRIVVVSSRLHEQGVIDWEALDGSSPIQPFKRPNAAYCNSKLANALFAKELSQRLEGSGVNVYTVCPGWNYTKLFRHSSLPWYSWFMVFPVAFWFMRPAQIGIQTIVHCTICDETQNDSGLFYADCEVYQSKANLDQHLALKLWEVSCKLCGLSQ